MGIVRLHLEVRGAGFVSAAPTKKVCWNRRTVVRDSRARGGRCMPHGRFAGAVAPGRPAMAPILRRCPA